MAPESDQSIIAALKQAEQALTGEKEFRRCLLESMADGVVACDANGILTLFNRSARDWHGMDPLRLPPAEWAQHYDLFRPDGITPLPTDEVPLARAFRGESVRDAGMAIKTKGQPIRFILANGSVILDEAGKKLGAVVIMRDVTEFRRLEMELRKSNEELEKRVEERTEELRQINRQLHLREHEFRTLANSLPDNIVRYDRQGRTVYVNPVLEKTLGAAAADMIGKRVREINPDGSYEAYAQALDAALASGGNGEIELTLFIPSEEPLVHQIRMIAEHDDHGEVTGVLAIGHDITERKRMEEERTQNFRYFESMDKINRAIQTATDLEGMLSDALDVVLDVFDCDRAFLLYPCDPGAPSWSVPMERCKPEYPGVLELGIEVPTSSDVAQTFRFLLEADGAVTFGPGTQHPLPADASERFGFKSMLSTALRPKVDSPWQFGLHQCSRVRNWTAEEERLIREIARRLTDGLNTMLIYRDLQKSEQRYRLVFRNSPVSIWEEDFSGVKVLLDGLKQEGVTDIQAHFGQHPEIIRQCAQTVKVVDVNEAALALHGAASKEALLEGLIETFTEESFDTFREELICLWEGENMMMRDAAVRTLTGERRDVTVYLAVCPGYENSLGKIFVSLIDITERKRVEEALRHSEASLNEAQRTAHLGNWELNLATNALHWSDEIHRIFEIDREQFGASYDAFLGAIHPDDREMVNRAYSQSLADCTPYDIVHRLLMKDGRIKYVEECCETFYDEDGRPLRSIGTVQDITERKRVEEELHLQTVELEEEVAERQMTQENLQEKALLLEEEIEKRQKTQEELEQLNKTLEQRVKERTIELEEKNMELHKMNRIFVGRELRMVELKERIRELEGA